MRIISRKFVAAAAVLAAAAATVTALTGPAAADPPTGVTPALIDQVAVGAEEMQSLTGVGVSHWNAQVPAPAFNSASWDATGSAQIMAKSTCNPTGNPPGIPRPNGASPGLAALNATTTTNVLVNGHRACVDVARSSRPPLPGMPTDTFFALARDAAGWAGFTSTATVQTDSPQTLSYWDLVRIFNCSYVSWNQITDVPGYVGPNVAIKVIVPQAGSGTRTDFLRMLGISDYGTRSCWQSAAPEANEGTDPVFNDPSVIVPYSVGHYIGQKYDAKGVGSDDSGYLDADRSVSLMPFGDQPGSSCSTVAGCAQVDPTNHVIGTDFSNTCFGHLLYYVALTADWIAPQTPGSESTELHMLFNKANDPTTPGWVCKANNASNPISPAAHFGYLPLSIDDCGTISLGH